MKTGNDSIIQASRRNVEDPVKRFSLLDSQEALTKFQGVKGKEKDIVLMIIY